jgi:hypothetical protein
MNHYIQQLYTALVAADEVTYDTISFLESYFNDSVFTTLDPPDDEPVTVPENIQEVREIVSDLFYKLWFSKNTLTDEQVLSLQTTIRDGKKQTGRTESEPLVFYKKDRNTLENREDLKGFAFDDICEDILENEINVNDIPGKFTFSIEEERPRLRKKDKSIQKGAATAIDDEPIIDSNTEDGNVY